MQTDPDWWCFIPALLDTFLKGRDHVLLVSVSPNHQWGSRIQPTNWKRWKNKLYTIFNHENILLNDLISTILSRKVDFLSQTNYYAFLFLIMMDIHFHLTVQFQPNQINTRSRYVRVSVGETKHTEFSQDWTLEIYLLWSAGPSSSVQAAGVAAGMWSVSIE